MSLMTEIFDIGIGEEPFIQDLIDELRELGVNSISDIIRFVDFTYAMPNNEVANSIIQELLNTKISIMYTRIKKCVETDENTSEKQKQDLLEKMYDFYVRTQINSIYSEIIFMYDEDDGENLVDYFDEDTSGQIFYEKILEKFKEKNK